MLKLRQTDETNNEQILLLQASCEQMKDQNNQLTNDLWWEHLSLCWSSTFVFVDLRMSNRKILELESTLKDTTSLAENSTEVTDLKKSLNRTVARHEEESTRMKTQLEELQKRLDHAGRSLQSFVFVITSLSDVLEKKSVEKDSVITLKSTEINAMEERYVQYLEKAKMVLRQMDPRNSNSISSQEIQSLKKQVDEKDRRYKDLEVNLS